MKSKGPLITLAAVAVLAVVLLVVNMSANSSDPPAEQAVATTAPATTAATAQTTPAQTTAAQAFPAEATYVGEIAAATGTITLAMAVDGDKAIAYACDGNTVEVWLTGSATDGQLALEGRNNSRLDGAYSGSDVSGTLWIGERSWTYTAAPATPPAGLYVAGDSDSTRVSWIVDQQGGVTGVLRAPDGATSPAPGLSDDGTATVNGTTVTAELVSGGDEIP
jgi:hypothetical protein